MAFTIQDLAHGIDFTGINPATGGDHNDLVDLAAPIADTIFEGKGLNLWSIDSAIDTPRVPDPTGLGATKWKRYTWTRIPHPVALTFVPILYVWNDNAPNHITFLKWVQVISDTAGLQTQITNLANQIATVQSTAVNAQTIANQANTTANTANTNSQNALNQIAGAVTTANQAKASADQATTDVANLTASVATLSGQVNTVVNTNIPTINALHQSFAALAEQAPQTVDLGNIAAGQNTRDINTVNSDNRGLVTLAAGKINFVAVGNYYIKAIIPFVPNGGAISLQSYIKKDSDNSLLVQGTSVVAANGGNTKYTIAEGIINISAPGETIRIDMHSSAALGKLGLAASNGGANFPAASVEVYTKVIIIKLT